jgi:hypothetical protein
LYPETNTLQNRIVGCKKEKIILSMSIWKIWREARFELLLRQRIDIAGASGPTAIGGTNLRQLFTDAGVQH